LLFDYVCLLIDERMNARSQMFDLKVEGRQADEAVASIFHTVLFHRTHGKFFYTTEGSYSIGTVGYTDVDCDFIDLTYVCCSSPLLESTLKREISCFSEQLRGNESTGQGQISLEFFQKRQRGRWLFQPDCIPWEVWTVRLELITLNSEGERQGYREKVGELLADKIFSIAEIMNRHDYVPKMPIHSELDLIFDTSYTDVQPYLFKVNYSISGPSSGTSVGSTVKKLIKETLSL
jgi:autophagy-related protein 101